MPSVKLYTSSSPGSSSSSSSAPAATNNPLPPLLQTPSGLAIVEIQGTIHAPFPSSDTTATTTTSQAQQLTATDIGRLEFPLYDGQDESDRWTKKVYLYVGRHQRLVGEVKKLAKAIAVIRRKRESEKEGREDEDEGELEIAEIIRWKIIFGGRPEPVGVAAAEEAAAASAAEPDGGGGEALIDRP